jgi:RNA recognition motif-containing protein
MITFAKAEAMHEAAEQVNGTFWHGRRITAVPRRADEEKREPRQNKFQRRERTTKAPTPYLYVGNMPYDISDSELTGLFDSVENATGVRIATDPSTGMPRGYAHIDFRSVADAEKAFETFSQVKIRERQLIVDYAEKREQSKRRPPVNRSRSEDWSKRD